MNKPVRRLSFIEDNIGKLRKSEVKVAEYIPQNAEKIIHFSLNELADNVGASEPTVIRFCRALGFSGWQEFKIYLAQAIIRAVGDPEQRFEEDPLRLLRAARFVSQLGFMIEPDTSLKVDPVAIPSIFERLCLRK